MLKIILVSNMPKVEGVEKDYKMAYMWLRLAATQGNRMALKNIAPLADENDPRTDCRCRTDGAASGSRKLTSRISTTGILLQIEA